MSWCLVWPTWFFSDNHDNVTNYLNRTRKKLSLPIRVSWFEVMQLVSSLHFPSIYQPTDTKKKETKHKPNSLNARFPKQTFRFGLCCSSVLFFDILWGRHNWLGFGIHHIWTPVIWDFKGYWGEIRDWKNTRIHGVQDTEKLITIRITGLRENLGWDDRSKEPY